MVDVIVSLGLFLSSDVVMWLILLIGYIWLDSTIFARITVMLMVGLIINMAIKVTWQIPLNPAIGKIGFAFPSSHMQSVITLYGGICNQYKHRMVSMLFCIVVVLVAFAERYSGYHSVADLIGGALVAWGILWFSQRCQQRYLVLLVGVTFILYYIHVQYGIPYHVWMAYGVSIGMLVGRHYLSSNIDLCWWQQGIATIIAGGICTLLVTYPMPCMILLWIGYGAVLPITCFLLSYCRE